MQNSVIELAERGVDVYALDMSADEADALAEVIGEVEAEDTAHALAGRLRKAGYLT